MELGGWLNYITFTFPLRFSLHSKKEGKIKEKPAQIAPRPRVHFSKVHIQDPPVYGGSAELTTSGPGLQKR